MIKVSLITSALNRQVLFNIKWGRSYLSSVRAMHLLQNKAFVNGDWCDSVTRKTFDVYNPSTGEIVGCVPDMDAVDMENAINSAYDAFHSKEWRSKTAKEYSQLLKNWFQLLEKNKEHIAQIMTLESGKPINESLGEVTYGNSFIEWFAEEARRIYGEIVPSPVASKKLMIIRQPIGVAGLITPWNFPHAMITRKAGAALAAGCSVIIKPAEDTPLTALALVKLAEEAGYPKGIINIVTSSRTHAAVHGGLLCKSPKVAGISFTGSTEVGKILYRQCADGIKRVGLELGGNAPFIVFKSADLDKAVSGAITSKFRNCGQTCVSPNRFLVQANIFEEFVDKLEKAVKKLKIGDGQSKETQIGPLINKAQLDKVTRLVDDAVNKHASVVTGGKPLPKLGKLFYSPTILTNVTHDMDLYNDEVFGPVVSIIKFETEEEAIRIANNTRRGLAGYFFTEDISQVFRVAKRLEVGMVGINEGMISTAEAAFGGVKESGLGREGSKHGIDDYVNIKYMCLGSLEY